MSSAAVANQPGGGHNPCEFDVNGCGPAPGNETQKPDIEWPKISTPDGSGTQEGGAPKIDPPQGGDNTNWEVIDETGPGHASPQPGGSDQAGGHNNNYGPNGKNPAHLPNDADTNNDGYFSQAECIGYFQGKPIYNQQEIALVCSEYPPQSSLPKDGTGQPAPDHPLDGPLGEILSTNTNGGSTTGTGIGSSQGGNSGGIMPGGEMPFGKPLSPCSGAGKPGQCLVGTYRSTGVQHLAGQWTLQLSNGMKVEIDTSKLAEGVVITTARNAKDQILGGPKKWDVGFKCTSVEFEEFVEPEDIEDAPAGSCFVALFAIPVNDVAVPYYIHVINKASKSTFKKASIKLIDCPKLEGSPGRGSSDHSYEAMAENPITLQKIICSTSS